MSYLYLMESNAKIGIRDNQITVAGTDSDKVLRTIPVSSVEGICVFGQPQISTHLIRTCISHNIPVGYYSENGRYFGSISSSQSVDPLRQKRQIYLTDDDGFCLAWSKSIIGAKVRNSISLLESMHEVYEFQPDETHGLVHSIQHLQEADSVEVALGFEGNAAKCYFSCLPKTLTNEKFAFKGRSSRPPKDPFNSMLSFGYTILYRNVIGAIERHGLHPYFAFMHKTRDGHAALASDLLEEYRAPLIDRTVLEMVNEEKVDPEDFYTNEAGAIYMGRETARELTNRISEVIVQRRAYLADYGDEKSYGFQAMLDRKIDSIVNAIEHHDASLYHPFIWKPAK